MDFSHGFPWQRLKVMERIKSVVHAVYVDVVYVAQEAAAAAADHFSDEIPFAVIGLPKLQIRGNVFDQNFTM